ncbi:SMI1/KNR4 family protein [Streptacidiphilus sp. ASG 303]|uniref:SMI1/KNR4 family protein n=1 Tax=Streptacidiphilus sp. ASG 303 TaxID=2896847 RepID=UPI001E406D53|nr:SMI1/KNR4 family protein [Streptacidiphilus sp. ASG 303]MCD0483530.1 SMI1/KNR4 family protein [Streptacidiphilus sp. ASG 303]
MDRSSFSAAWLARWRADLSGAVQTLPAGFESTHGYPPGVNEVRPPDEAGRRAAQQFSGGLLGFEDLAVFYDTVGEVCLPDVANGFFLHRAGDVLHRLSEDGPVHLSPTGELPGLVIASNGGGQQYIVDHRGAVHRTRTASTDTADLDQVADTFPAFLDLVRHTVLRFTRTGDPGTL